MTLSKPETGERFGHTGWAGVKLTTTPNPFA